MIWRSFAQLTRTHWVRPDVSSRPWDPPRPVVAVAQPAVATALVVLERWSRRCARSLRSARASSTVKQAKKAAIPAKMIHSHEVTNRDLGNSVYRAVWGRRARSPSRRPRGRRSRRSERRLFAHCRGAEIASPGLRRCSNSCSSSSAGCYRRAPCRHHGGPGGNAAHGDPVAQRRAAPGLRWLALCVAVLGQAAPSATTARRLSMVTVRRGRLIRRRRKSPRLIAVDRSNRIVVLWLVKGRGFGYGIFRGAVAPAPSGASEVHSGVLKHPLCGDIMESVPLLDCAGRRRSPATPSRIVRSRSLETEARSSKEAYEARGSTLPARTTRSWLADKSPEPPSDQHDPALQNC